MRYEFALTFDDFKAACKLSARHPRNWIVLLEEPWDAIVLLCVLAAIPLALAGEKRWVGLAPLLFAAWHWHTGVFRVQRELKRQYAAIPPDGHGVIFEPTEEAFCIWYKNSSNSIPWDSLKKWRENKTHLIVCQPDTTMHIIPKRIFASDLELWVLRDRLTKAVGKAM